METFCFSVFQFTCALKTAINNNTASEMHKGIFPMYVVMCCTNVQNYSHVRKSIEHIININIHKI